MRLVVQRVSRAEVRVDGRATGSIGRGLLVLAGALRGDTILAVRKLAEKCAHLRVFEDESGRMNLSPVDIGGGVLVVSQFTLAADTRKGRRPNFEQAMPPEEAEPLLREFVREVRSYGLQVEEGVFGAHMEVELVNDGPVTIILESHGD